jgi:hypothetical protein
MCSAPNDSDASYDASIEHRFDCGTPALGVDDFQQGPQIKLSRSIQIAPSCIATKLGAQVGAKETGSFANYVVEDEYSVRIRQELNITAAERIDGVVLTDEI